MKKPKNVYLYYIRAVGTGGGPVPQIISTRLMSPFSFLDKLVVLIIKKLYHSYNNLNLETALFIVHFFLFDILKTNVNRPHCWYFLYAPLFYNFQSVRPSDGSDDLLRNKIISSKIKSF